MENKNVENLDVVNMEMAEFLGEKNLPVTTDTEIKEMDKEKIEYMEVINLGEITEEEKQFIEQNINNFMKKLKNNPLDLTLSSDVYKIGKKSAEMALPNVSLYDKLISDIMEENKKGPEVEGSKDYNLLRLKRELDMINPAVLSKTPIKKKVLLFFNKSELPGTDKILNMIYERKETVKSTVEGIKLALLENADMLDRQLADLMQIYKGLYQSHRMLKIEIHTAQRIFNEVKKYMETVKEPEVKSNIETVLADLVTQINSLVVEENMNSQFFAGSQLTAKLVREQQNQIRILVRQMEKAVLANLGLRVVSKGLEESVKTSKALGEAIANTIADTAKANEKTTEQLQKARVEGYINLDKLQEGINALERTFEKQAKANELIVKQGVAVTNKIREATERLEQKIDNSQELKA